MRRAVGQKTNTQFTPSGIRRFKLYTDVTNRRVHPVQIQRSRSTFRSRRRYAATLF